MFAGRQDREGCCVFQLFEFTPGLFELAFGDFEVVVGGFELVPGGVDCLRIFGLITVLLCFLFRFRCPIELFCRFLQLLFGRLRLHRRRPVGSGVRLIRLQRWRGRMLFRRRDRLLPFQLFQLAFGVVELAFGLFELAVGRFGFAFGGFDGTRALGRFAFGEGFVFELGRGFQLFAAD